LALALEEKYDQVRQLINMGKERGYLLYDEVNDILPAEVHSSEEIDDLLSTFERYGIDIYEDAATAKAARAAADAESGGEAEPAKEEPAAEESELDLTPGALEKTNDPVRMYLREMGTVPLLTRGRRSYDRQAHRARTEPRPEDHFAFADRPEGIDGRGKGSSRRRALDQGNRSV